MPEPGCALVMLRLPGVSLAVRSEVVQEIGDAARATGVAIDLAALLGLAAPDGARRAIRVAPDRWLLAGERIDLRTVARSAFRPLPPWIEAVAVRQPLRSLVHTDDGLAYELDVDRALAGTGREPEERVDGLG